MESVIAVFFILWLCGAFDILTQDPLEEVIDSINELIGNFEEAGILKASESEEEDAEQDVFFIRHLLKNFANRLVESGFIKTKPEFRQGLSEDEKNLKAKLFSDTYNYVVKLIKIFEEANIISPCNSLDISEEDLVQYEAEDFLPIINDQLQDFIGRLESAEVFSKDDD